MTQRRSQSKIVSPVQVRAQQTYERLLDVAAQTLAEVGLDQWNTNLVCARAGVTPPALYRYFSNKFSLLEVLGRRLMAVQNERLMAWASTETFASPDAELAQSLIALFLDTYEMTSAYPAGIAITRALRVVPQLHGVVMESHQSVSQALTDALSTLHADIERSRIELVARSSVQMAYGLLEMVMDEPQHKPDDVARLLAASVIAMRNTLATG